MTRILNHKVSSISLISIHFLVGVIKLWVPNLAAIDGGIIRFDDKLPLALFRTKANDVCEYLKRKNEVNEGVQEDNPRLSWIPIPQDQNSKLPKAVKDAIDTTRVRLCFQVKNIE